MPFSRLLKTWLAIAVMLPCALLSAQAQNEQRLNSPDPQSRVRAILSLPAPVGRAGADTVAQVIELLDDSSRVVLRDAENRLDVSTSPAREARRYLIRFGDAAMPGLLSALVANRPSIRWRVAQILGEIGGRDVTDALLDAMSQDGDDLVRMTAAEALVALGAKATPALLELLREGSEKQIEQVIWILSESGDDRALPHLLNLAMHGQGPNAERAVDALLKIGPRIVPQLLAIIENPEADVSQRLRAIQIASAIPHPSVLNSLCFLVLASETDAVRDAALSALAIRKDTPEVIDTLLNALYDVDRRFAMRVPEVMAQFDGRAAVILEGYLANPSPRLQAYAIEGLRNLRGYAIPTLVHLVETPLYGLNVRQQAAGLLRRFGYRGITFDTRVNAMTLVGDWAGLSLLGRQLEPHFSAMMNHPEAMIREAGINLLSDLQLPQYTSRYLDLTRDSDPMVRAAALRALGRLDRLAFSDMTRQLDRHLTRNIQNIGDVLLKGGYRPRTDYDRLRLFAAVDDWENVAALGESAVALLLERLRGEDADVAAWAAWTLARFGDRSPLDRFSLRQLDSDFYDLLFQQDDAAKRAAYRLLGAATERKAAPYLLVPLLMRDNQNRVLAADALGTQGAAAVKLLELCLNADTPVLQERALLALRKCGPVAYPVLLKKMTDPVVGPSVLAALDDMNYRPSGDEEEAAYLTATHEYSLLARLGRRALQPLYDAASDAGNPDRVRAIHAMGETPDEGVYETLVLLLNDPDASVRQAVLDTFARMGEPAIPPLLRLAAYGHLMQSRGAAQALAHLGYTPAHPEEEIWLAAARNDWPFLQARKAESYAILRRSLLDENAPRRALAANAVSSIREFEVMAIHSAAERLSPDLISSLRDDNPESRALAAFFCGRYGSGNTNLVSSLLPLLADNTPVLWAGDDLLGLKIHPTPGVHAAIALSKIGPSVIPALLRYYEQSDAEARFNASLALCSIPHESLLNHQIRALLDPSYELRFKAVESLGRAGLIQAIPPMINAALAPDSKLLQPVALAIRRIGMAALPTLRTELENAASSNRRRFLLELFAQIEAPESIPYIVPYTVDSDIQVRKMAYYALSRIHEPSAMDMVVDALGDDFWSVRESAAGQIVEVGERMIPSLIGKLRNDDSPKSKYIQRVLQQITGEGLGSNVRAWEKWYDQKKSSDPALVE